MTATRFRFDGFVDVVLVKEKILVWFNKRRINMLIYIQQKHTTFLSVKIFP